MGMIIAESIVGASLIFAVVAIASWVVELGVQYPAVAVAFVVVTLLLGLRLIRASQPVEPARYEPEPEDVEGI